MVKYPPPKRIGDWTEYDNYLQEIGRFILEFSHLEFMLRGFLIEVAKLRSTQVESIVGAIDFAAICKLCQNVAIERRRSIPKKTITSFFGRCLALNSEARIPIVHGTWLYSEEGLYTLHLSRQTFQDHPKFEKRENIIKVADEAHSLTVELVKLLTDLHEEKEGSSEEKQSQT